MERRASLKQDYANIAQKTFDFRQDKKMENFSTQTQDINVDYHFREATKMVRLGSRAKG